MTGLPSPNRGGVGVGFAVIPPSGEPRERGWLTGLLLHRLVIHERTRWIHPVEDHPSMPRTLLAAVAFLAFPVALSAKPNIVFFLCDDLGYVDLGCFASKVIKTPHLDNLAASGIRLTHCYSPSPVCSPSRAGFLTGRNPNRLGIRDWIPLNSGVKLNKDEISAAKLLQAAGYRTGHVGKWHLNSKMDGSEPTPGDHGFDHWFATQNNAIPSHENPTNFVRNGKPAGKLTGNSSTLIVDEALRFLDATRDQPFALFVWFHAPHEPVATPAEWTNL